MKQAINLIDGYKTGHREQYPEGTSFVYSNFTPRSDKRALNSDGEGVVVFGVQYMIQRWLVSEYNRTFFSEQKVLAVARFKRTMDSYLGKDAVGTDHVEALHDLGYLPVKIKSLPEGTLCPIGVPMFTIENEGEQFYWITNFLETLISSIIWKISTSATTARLYKKIFTKWAIETGSPLEFVPFQGHDFSFRGMSGPEDAASSAGAALTSMVGTDTIPALEWLEDFYGANIENELVGCSVNATEHSVMCLGEKESEIETFRRLITEIYKTGIVSIVSDTWDFWKVVTEYLPTLKEEILARDGKVVIRPDSGDPVDILCGSVFREVDSRFDGDFEEWKEWVAESMDYIFCENLDAEEPHYDETSNWKYEDKYFKVTYTPDLNRHDKTYYYVDNMKDTVDHCEFVEYIPSASDKGLIECLWDTFGGTVNEKGFKVLDEHIGAIYGDSITLERAEQIMKRLAAKGFASCNVVLGIGSFTYQYVTRDTYGFAMKATYGIVNGEGREIFKDPKTDVGSEKKSAKGLLHVYEEDGVYKLKDQATEEEKESGCLETIYEKGAFVKRTTLAEVRERVNNTIK